MRDSVKTQVIRIPPESSSALPSDTKPAADQVSGKEPAAEEGKKVTGIKSNLSPEAKSFLGRLSKAQIIALAAGVPIFGAIAYGVVKASATGTEAETGGILKDVWNSGGVPQTDPQLVESQPVQGSGPGISVSVTDDQPFKEAFDTARAELGPGNFFIWKGNIYGTYDKEEWEHLSDEQKEDYFENIPYDVLPDFAHSEGLPTVNVRTEPDVAPGEIVIEPIVVPDPVVPDPPVDPEPIVPEPVVEKTLAEYVTERDGLQAELDTLTEGLPTEEQIASGNLTEWQAEWVRCDEVMSVREIFHTPDDVDFGPDPAPSDEMIALRARITDLEFQISNVQAEIDLHAGEPEVTDNVGAEVIPDITDISYFEETTTDTGWTTDPQPEDL